MATETSFKLDRNGRPYIDKTPQEGLIYGLDLASWEASAGDIALSATVAAGGTLSAGPATAAGGVVAARISGGTVGEFAPVTFTWTTAGGGTGQRTIWLRIVAARP